MLSKWILNNVGIQEYIKDLRVFDKGFMIGAQFASGSVSKTTTMT